MDSQQQQLEVYGFLFAGTLVMFLLAGGVLAFFILYQKRLFNQQLKMREMEVIFQESLLHGNIESVEEERKRIATDLHDEIGSIFSTLRLKLGQLNQLLQPEDLSIFRESDELIDAGIKSVRRISHNIIPPGLEMFGLVDTLEAICENLSVAEILDANLQCETLIDRFDPKIELGLFRVVQELTNNTLKHANASQITINLKQDQSGLHLTYADNGKGFDPEIMNSPKGLGLKNIEARVNLLKGSISWDTKPGNGLKTNILIPVSLST
jgi:two-component system NarL family sensor kinase